MLASEDSAWPFVGGVAGLLALRAGIPGGISAPQHDVRHETQWQARDVDLVVGDVTAKHLAVEAKIDSYASGQVPIEFLSNTVRGTPGWAWYCEADRLVFIRPALQRALVLDWKPMQRRLIALRETWPLMETSTRTQSGSLYGTVCRLVPVRDLLAMTRLDGRPLAREFPLCLLADLVSADAIAARSHELPPHPNDRHPLGARRVLAASLSQRFVAQEQSWATRWEQLRTSPATRIAQGEQVTPALRVSRQSPHPRTHSPSI